MVCLIDKVKILGIALLFFAFNSAALTLGRVRGAALVGQPLDLVVQVQLSEGEDLGAQCFEAEVFYADSRVESNRVRVVVEPSAQAQVANVRILSSAVVDEPVVNVYFRSGCAQKTTRRYVLLADLLSELAAPVAPAIQSVVPQVLLKPAPLIQRPAESLPIAKAKRARAPKSATSKPATAKAKRAKSVEKSKAERPAGQSRLKLDPLDMFSDRVANLDSFMTFELPEDALRNSQRLLTLEGAVKAGLASAAKNDATLLDLKTRLQKAESERFPDSWLYGLVALVLAGLAAVAFLLFRQRSRRVDNGDWLSGSVIDPATAVSKEAAPADAAPSGVSHDELDFMLEPEVEPPLSDFNTHSTPMSEVDVNLVEMSDSKFDSFMATGSALAEHTQAAMKPLAELTHPQDTSLNLNAETTLDIRQQAEFFVSLGQTGRAVRILKKKIDVGDDLNPLLYLDLLDIYHSLNLKVDFTHLRDEFNSLFSGVVPEFAFFKKEGNGLAFYPDVLMPISGLWVTPDVLNLIEMHIFQNPRNPLSRAFDLAAFRDLLMLHAVAHIILFPLHQDDGDDQNGALPGFLNQANKPQSFTDIDFSEPSKVKPSKPSTPEVLDFDLDLDLSAPVTGRLSPVANPDGANLDVDFPLLVPDVQTGDSINFDVSAIHTKG